MTEGDISKCIELGYAMHQESYFKNFEYNNNKLTNLLTAMVSNPQKFCGLVAEKDGEVIGLFIGLSDEHWFGTNTMSCDLAFYVIPSERGSMAGIKLIKAYEEWARSIGVSEIILGIYTGINADRTSSLLQRLGYGDEAFSFRKRNLI